MKNKIDLFVVFHDKLNDCYYNDDIIDNYKFINVNPNNDLNSINSKFEIINQYEINNFIPLGKCFAESEVIYNIYKNSYLYENLDYIGFLQHDIDSSILKQELIENLILNYDHINFQPYLFVTDYNQKILMDVNQPNKKTGKGVNCYDIILEDYNLYYGTNYKLSDLSDEILNLCSSFILKTNLFVEMMAFISYIIESNKLEKFDTERKHRIQGGYLERYYAIWLALNNLKSTVVKLEHHFAESTVEVSLLDRFLRKIGLNVS